MGLLSRSRRLLALVILALLALPVLLLPARPIQTVSIRENRVLAPPPTLPRTLAEARSTPRQIDAYLSDHFAFRDLFVRTGNRLQKQLGVQTGPTRQAVEGRDGWIFYKDGLLESSGQVHQLAQTTEFSDFICDLNADLVGRGMKTGFTLVPSPGEIYPEALPAWAGPARRPTDYDYVLARVRACGVPAVDLRPALIAAKRHGLIYRRTDSHWTLLGAVVGYNAMLDAIGQPDWRLPIDPRHWYERSMINGDLPAMAGLEPREERVPMERRFEEPAPPKATIEGVHASSRPPFVVQGEVVGGPTVLIIGDSFTENPMLPLFLKQVGRYAWVHHEECAFDRGIFDKLKPDVVLIAPAERDARCRGGRSPHVPAR